MFAIIITEKGGTERREVFDKTEINVGRVQGNELMLPKGNVSKHHARLLYRDGRFIVTDLKSTNGTYVNGRKITQATIVREGDKIYVGDFIFRLEMPPQTGASAATPVVAEPAEPVGSSRNPAAGPPSPDNSQPSSPDSGISHFPLEQDPDEPSWAGSPQRPSSPPLRMPAPPRVPSGAQIPAPMPYVPPHVPQAAPAAPARAPAAPPAPPARPIARVSNPEPPPPPAPIAVQRAPSVPSVGIASRSAQSPALRQSVPLAPITASDSAYISPERAAAAALLRRIEDSFDLSSIDNGTPPNPTFAERIEHSLREEIHAIRASGELSAQTDVEAVVREAREELIGVGPLGELFRDDDVTEIRIHRHSWVSSVRTAGPRRAEPPFASETSLQRILRRLCVRSGQPALPGETIVNRFVSIDNVHLAAAFGPSARPGTAATLRKCSTASHTLDDLVRAGALSRSMATFLSHAVAGHVNALITTGPGADPRMLLSALLRATRPTDHALLLAGTDCTLALSNNATFIPLPSGADGAAVLRASAKLDADCLFVATPDGTLLSEVIDAVASGTDSVVAVVRAPSLRHALDRIGPNVASARSGLTPEIVREAVSSAFDLFIEVARMRDGRVRVVRIAEPSGLEARTVGYRDIFNFVPERTTAGGTIEGSFQPTGIVPRAVEALDARGITLEPSLFHR